jgi:hypothetical protein
MRKLIISLITAAAIAATAGPALAQPPNPCHGAQVAALAQPPNPCHGAQVAALAQPPTPATAAVVRSSEIRPRRSSSHARPACSRAWRPRPTSQPLLEFRSGPVGQHSRPVRHQDRAPVVDRSGYEAVTDLRQVCAYRAPPECCPRPL